MTDINKHFASVSPVIAGQPFEREHALVLQAYRHFLGQPLEAGFRPTAATINEAIQWWNATVVGAAE